MNGRTCTALARLVLSIVLTMLSMSAAWMFAGRDKAVAATGQYPSLSFAPYRIGQSPKPGQWPSRAQVAEDIARLAPFTAAIRTYSACDYGDTIPLAARAHGLKVWLGVWLGPKPADNRRELRCGIDLAQRYPDVVERLTVGNEAVFRGDVTVSTLTALLDQARTAVRQPVSYADVPGTWLTKRRIAAHVDEVAVHLLPYWDESDFAARGNPRQESLNALKSLEQCRDALPGHRLVVAEVGWPSYGRQRGSRVPSRKFQADFIAEFSHLAQMQDLHFNVIEAFDQHWKAAYEGAVGANWGVLDVHRQPKVSTGARVSEYPDWLARACASITILIAGLASAALMARHFGIAVLPASMSIVLPLCLLHGVIAFSGPWLWRLCYTQAQMCTVAGSVAGQMIFVNLAAITLAGGAAAAERGLRYAIVIAVLVTLCFQILLALSPYYRQFPSLHFAAIAAAFVWLYLRKRQIFAATWDILALACPLLLVASLKVFFSESWINVQSDLWLALATVIAIMPALRHGCALSPLSGNGLVWTALFSFVAIVLCSESWPVLWFRIVVLALALPAVLLFVRRHVDDRALRFIIVCGTALIACLFVYRKLYVDGGTVGQSCLSDGQRLICRIRSGFHQLQLLHLLGLTAIGLALLGCVRGNRRLASAGLLVGLAAIANGEPELGAIGIAFAALGLSGIGLVHWGDTAQSPRG